jgi:O-antigen/teichoic acid export membrane protein
LDRALIASFVSLAAVTLYTVPTEVMTRLRIIPSSLVTTLYPAFSERGTEDQKVELQRLYGGSVRYLLIAMLPGILFLLAFGTDLLSVWMGPRFAQQTALVLQILGLGVLLNCMANIPYNALQALGRPDITGKFHLFELPLYVVLCLALIPRFGIAGAALANSLRISLDAGLLFWAAQRYCHCSIAPLWATAIPRVFGLNGILALSLVGIRLSVIPSWGRLGMGVIAVGAYFVGVWLLLVDKDDKPRIGQAVRLLIRQPAS